MDAWIVVDVAGTLEMPLAGKGKDAAELLTNLVAVECWEGGRELKVPNQCR